MQLVRTSQVIFQHRDFPEAVRGVCGLSSIIDLLEHRKRLPEKDLGCLEIAFKLLHQSQIVTG